MKSAIAALLLGVAAWAAPASDAAAQPVAYRTAQVEGLDIFYREAGR